MGLFLGFLLGKFVSDRQYKIRELTKPKYMAVIEQIQTLGRSIEMNAQNFSDSMALVNHPIYNRKLWDESTCADKTIDQNYDITFDVFIEKLLDKELHVAVQCLIKLNNALISIGKN